MGLTRTDDQEVSRIFDPEMTSYLKSQILIELPNVKPTALSSLQVENSFSNDKMTPRFMPESDAQTKHTPLTKLLPEQNSDTFARGNLGAGFDIFSQEDEDIYNVGRGMKIIKNLS